MIGGAGMSLYDRLRGVTLADLNQTQLKAVLDGVSIDGKTAGDNEIATAIYAAKAVQSGLTPQCIQTQGAINVTTLVDASPILLQPSSETWRIQSLHAINNDGSDAINLTVKLSDGTTSFAILTKALSAGAEFTFQLLGVMSDNLLTPQLFFDFSAAGSGTINVAISTAYQVVQQ